MPRMEQKRMMTMLAERRMGQAHEVVDHTDGDEDPEDDEELALLGEIGLTGLPDDVGDIKHGLVGRQILRLFVLNHGENQTDEYRQEDRNT